jgi:hypothetical protein
VVASKYATLEELREVYTVSDVYDFNELLDFELDQSLASQEEARKK